MGDESDQGLVLRWSSGQSTNHSDVEGTKDQQSGHVQGVP